ncbi:dihydropteroate synthase [Commensalibacter papalotli (ex Servin-Garciduenas et al. 2014)]|uniref:Dihydropteroate synthase n=1 Tax=Commensalibacter papalotli (ex Servin-Garciduenas et al. 2014) TaxID=1208583 RepID=W7DW86_9PROT|nr:dihydropteroate synthase [Commensalibacter papalotli (ex Servin-Garciduenas et al. 2014)]EUK18478.1 dihydropteroate synthase [Commensalibacter papalotli (ex Servin-Garciduenas et al. 2014)]
MQKDLFIEPLSFLYDDIAQQAIKSKKAYPFLGQKKLAFSMLRSINSDQNGLPISMDAIPMHWQEKLEQFSLPLPLAGLPNGSLVMGILNITPDSFSDGGKYFRPNDAVRAAHQMVQDGAVIIDIGGESTRPGSIAITPQEECERILPVIKALQGCGALLSVDTRHAYTMRYALEAGVDIINDISALEDPLSAKIIADAKCPVMLMHMRGTPQTMVNYTNYDNILYDVLFELQQKIEFAEQAGIHRDQIIIDPGIGFAKNKQHNLLLIKHFPIFANLGCRLLLAVSRKRFIKEIMSNIDCEHYDWGTIVSSLPFMMVGNGIIRVHNVPAMVQSMKLWQALH